MITPQEYLDQYWWIGTSDSIIRSALWLNDKDPIDPVQLNQFWEQVVLKDPIDANRIQALNVVAQQQPEPKKKKSSWISAKLAALTIAPTAPAPTAPVSATQPNGARPVLDRRAVRFKEPSQKKNMIVVSIKFKPAVVDYAGLEEEHLPVEFAIDKDDFEQLKRVTQLKFPQNKDPLPGKTMKKELYDFDKVQTDPNLVQSWVSQHKKTRDEWIDYSLNKNTTQGVTRSPSRFARA